MSDNNIQEIDEIFTDGVGTIHFFGDMIRLDLVSFQPSTGEDKQNPVPTVTKRIVMNPNAFLRSYESIISMIQKLIDAKVLTSKTAEEQTTEEAADK